MNILNEMRSWHGAVEIDGTMYKSITDAISENKSVSSVDSIKLVQTQQNAEKHSIQLNTEQFIQYKITVKQYMTRPASPAFDFMSVWNNNIPMPLRTMIGTIEKETPGMVYMNLSADTDGKPVQYCMKCGKAITNPVSQFFGMGPECGGHNYINPFESEEELNAVVENYRKNYLNKITWSGWVIKSAITEQEVYNG